MRAEQAPPLRSLLAARWGVARRSVLTRRLLRRRLPAMTRCEAKLLARAVAGQQIQNRPQSPLYRRQPLARVAPDQLVDRRFIRRDRRRHFFELASRARERQAFDQQQMLDPQHLLDVHAAVHARGAGALRDTQLWKLRLPRPQHVGLHLDEVAHFSRFEQRALRDLDVRESLRHGRRKVYQTPEWPKPPLPRLVSGRSTTSSHVTRTTGATTSCAIRMPRATTKGSSL